MILTQTRLNITYGGCPVQRNPQIFRFGRNLGEPRWCVQCARACGFGIGQKEAQMLPLNGRGFVGFRLAFLRIVTQ